MMYSQLLVSIILIICGFLVKKYPDLIAGYNTLSPSEKAKIDSKGLALFLKQVLIGLGTLNLVSFLLLTLYHVSDKNILYFNSVLLIVLLLLSLFVVNRRYKI